MLEKTSNRAILAVLGVFLLAWLLAASPLAAQGSYTGRLEPPKVTVQIAGDPPVTLTADDILADLNRDLSHFIGNVKIVRGAETIVADRAVWHEGSNTAEISGNIRITAPDFSITATRAVVNLDLNLAKVYDGHAFFPAQNYYLNGAVVERLGEKTFQVTDGTATTCDGPSPAWTITASRLTVTEGGYAAASGAALNTRHFPVLALPYFVFPIKNERQSGFLMPYVGSSSRDGATVSLPFFWATGENHDLTLTPVWREERGLATTLEGRYHFNEGRGIWQFTYLDDKKGEHFSYKNSAGAREARDRYWLRAQNNWQAAGWDFTLDLDVASDPLFLTSFRSDLDGFFRSAQLFTSEFGRTVNEYLDPMRVSTFTAQKAGYDSLFRATAQYTQDVYSRDNRETLQRLPALQYSLVSRPLPLGSEGPDLSVNRPRLSVDMRYDNFYRHVAADSPTDEKGQRVVLEPSLEWSTPVADVATLEMEGSLGVHMYGVNGHEYDAALPVSRQRERRDQRDNSLGGSFTASLSSTVGRVYEGGLGKAVATRHQLIPTITYNYVEAQDQDELPYWDFRDRQLSRRTVRYGLMNTFVSKTPVAAQPARAGEAAQPESYNYFQFLKVGLWSSYEFADNERWADDIDARYYTTDYYDQGAGPVELEVEAFFNPHFSLRALAGVDGRTGRVVSQDIGLTVRDPRGDSFSLTYDYDSPANVDVSRRNNLLQSEYEEVRANLNVVFTPQWLAGVSTRYDVRDGRPLETNAHLLYQAQCYKIGVIFTDSEDDQRVGLIIDLLGLGAFNSNQGVMAGPPGQFYY
jgi:LPS-assembly protein